MGVAGADPGIFHGTSLERQILPFEHAPEIAVQIFCEGPVRCRLPVENTELGDMLAKDTLNLKLGPAIRSQAGHLLKYLPPRNTPALR